MTNLHRNKDIRVYRVELADYSLVQLYCKLDELVGEIEQFKAMYWYRMTDAQTIELNVKEYKKKALNQEIESRWQEIRK